MNKRVNLQYNRVAVTAFVICVLGGFILSAITKSPAPLLIGIFAGLYLLHAIKVVQQWEKVALLRVGRYVGLRGPGIFLIVPVLETLSPYVDQRVQGGERFRGVDADARHGAGGCGRDRLLAGVECGESDSGSGELY